MAPGDDNVPVAVLISQPAHGAAVGTELHGG